mgnify:CR=1 FL=1
MPGYSPKLPLQTDGLDGIGLNTTFEEVVKQNLKMILLTNPGEKVMDPEFGVGLYRFLFEYNGRDTYELIETKIAEQISYYYPFVEIRSFEIEPNSNNVDKSHSLSIIIRYLITSSSLEDVLEVVLDIPEF